MDKILRLLVAHYAFLYKEYGFRFVDSRYSAECFGDAVLVLESDWLRIKFTSDRAELFVDFQSKHQTGRRRKEWHSIDLVRQLVTHEEEYHPRMDKGNAGFLRAHMPRIVSLFSEAQIDDTCRALKELETIRSKKLFG